MIYIFFSFQNEYLNQLICQQENLLFLIQKYFQICQTTIDVDEENSAHFNPEITGLKNLFCMSRLQNLPSNQDLYIGERRVQVRFLFIFYFI